MPAQARLREQLKGTKERGTMCDRYPERKRELLVAGNADRHGGEAQQADEDPHPHHRGQAHTAIEHDRLEDEREVSGRGREDAYMTSLQSLSLDSV